MSQSDEHTENTNSLLRRLLNKRQEPRIPHEDLPERKVEALPPDAVISPIPSRPASSPLSPDTPVSPIRPKILDNTEPQPPLTPTLPERSAPEEPLTPREQMQRAEEALINLRQKMANVASEFAQGKLNQAQFDAIYSRYSEQRMITEGCSPATRKPRRGSRWSGPATPSFSSRITRRAWCPTRSTTRTPMS